MARRPKRKWTDERVAVELVKAVRRSEMAAELRRRTALWAKQERALTRGEVCSCGEAPNPFCGVHTSDAELERQLAEAEGQLGFPDRIIP